MSSVQIPSFECIKLEINDGVALLTLNRPDRLNSFTQKMHAEVRESLTIVKAGRESGTVRVLVLTGLVEDSVLVKIYPIELLQPIVRQ